MLWFNFILGLILVFLCVKLVIIVYHKQNKENETCIKEKITPYIIYTHDICASPCMSKRSRVFFDKCTCQRKTVRYLHWEKKTCEGHLLKRTCWWRSFLNNFLDMFPSRLHLQIPSMKSLLTFKNEHVRFWTRRLVNGNKITV